MSVVVASHYTHNLTTGKKEVRFLSNVEVPLPSIQFSKIEKQRTLAANHSVWRSVYPKRACPSDTQATLQGGLGDSS